MNPTWLYVGILYLVATLLARRGGVMIPWRVAAFFLGITYAFLFRPLFLQVASFPADIVKLMVPWSATSNSTTASVSRFELQDLTMQIVPWAHQVREAWKSGRLPLWNARAGCGYPLLGNAQSSAFSIVRLLALPLPLDYAMTAESAMKVLLALTFMYLFCRRRSGELGSVAAATAFALGTFVQVWLHFPIATTAVFLPAILLHIDLVMEKPTFVRLASGAVVWFCILAAGHPETAMLIGITAGAFALWRWKRNILAAALTLALGVLLAAPIVATFVEAVVRSRRFAEEAHSPLGVAWSDFPSLVELLQPRAFGRPMIAEMLCGFASLGAIAACVTLLIRCARRRDWRSDEAFLVLLALFALWIVNDLPPFHHQWTSVFKSIFSPRWRLVLSFAMAASIAPAIDPLGGDDESRQPEVFRTSITGGIVIAAALIVYATIRADVVKPAFMIPSAVVLLCMLFRWRLAMPLTIAFELWFNIGGFHPTVPRSAVYPRTPLLVAMDGLRASAREPFRIAGISGSLFPNTQAVFGLDDIRVHDPMAPARYFDLLRTTRNFAADNYYPKFGDADTPLLDVLNVRYLVTAPGFEVSDRGRYRLVYDGFDGRIWENGHVRPRFFSDDARIRIVSAGDDSYRLAIDSRKETTIESSITRFPGWTIEPPLRTVTLHGALLGFIVPPGRTDVRLRYAPRSFAISAALSLLTWIGLAAGVIRQRPVRLAM